jgi:hypothetical protein
MSIGIAVAIGDLVLMVADGRRSNAFAVQTNEADKIIQLSESRALIEFGVVMASASAVEELATASPRLTSGGELIACLSTAVRKAGARLVSVVLPDSTDMSRIKVGLLAGGIDAAGPYVGGALYGHGMNEPSVLLVRLNPAPQWIVLGGEACGAQKYFRHEIERAYGASGTDQNTFLTMAKRAAKKTVTHAASHDRTIGGRVQYCVIQHEQQLQRGIL